MGVLAWKILEARALDTRNGEAAARSLAWQFAWVAMILINIKQASFALLVLLLRGMLLVVLRDPKLRFVRIFRLLPIMSLPALSVFIAWRYHTRVHLPDGEVIILSVNPWRLGEALNIFANMLMVASRKGFYFSMMGR